jgi:hypothetical protein
VREGLRDHRVGEHREDRTGREGERECDKRLPRLVEEAEREQRGERTYERDDDPEPEDPPR